MIGRKADGPHQRIIYHVVGSVLDSRADNGYGGLGSDSGECALETADTTKVGSSRENYPMRIS